MRIAIILLFGIIIQANADIYSQTTSLSLDMQNATVEEVLLEVENKSEFYFLYNSKLVNVDRLVNVQLKNSNIESVLKTIFANTDITYKIEDRQIILSKKEFHTSQIQQGKKFRESKKMKVANLLSEQV